MTIFLQQISKHDKLSVAKNITIKISRRLRGHECFNLYLRKFRHTKASKWSKCSFSACFFITINSLQSQKIGIYLDNMLTNKPDPCGRWHNSEEELNALQRWWQVWRGCCEPCWSPPHMSSTVPLANWARRNRFGIFWIHFAGWASAAVLLTSHITKVTYNHLCA